MRPIPPVGAYPQFRLYDQTGDTPRSATTKIAINIIPSIVLHPFCLRKRRPLFRVRERCLHSRQIVPYSVFADKLAFCLSFSGTVDIFGCHGNLNVNALLELYIIALLVS